MTCIRAIWMELASSSTGRIKVADGAFALRGELDALVLETFVEKAEAIAAQGGRSALRSIDFEVLTATGKTCHECSSPSPG